MPRKKRTSDRQNAPKHLTVSSGKNYHKHFWVVLGLLIALSFVVILNSRGAPSITGQVAIQTLSFVKAGSSLEMEITTIPGWKAMIVNVQRDIKNGKIYVSEDKTIPFTGVSLSKSIVASPNAAQLGRTELILKVSRQSLRQAGLTESEVAVYVNNKAIPTLQTYPQNLLGDSDAFVYYSASIDQFTEGHYVIGKQKLGVSIPPVPQQPATTPLFEQLKSFFQRRVR